ncbi:MAG: hypothetical protein JWP21_1194, partial [Tardiphaga sp.]|nr:hypothetical protein [Tardiphaga sp.]
RERDSYDAVHQCADGITHEAWTYIYNWPIDGLPRIASGRFGDHAR